MTPEDRAHVTQMVDRLNEAAEEFRTSRDHTRTALLALIEANEAQVRSIDKVIEANRIALRLLNS